MFLFDTAKEFFDMIHSPFIDEVDEFEIIQYKNDSDSENESEIDEEKGLTDNENQIYNFIMSFIDYNTKID